MTYLVSLQREGGAERKITWRWRKHSASGFVGNFESLKALRRQKKGLCNRWTSFPDESKKGTRGGRGDAANNKWPTVLLMKIRRYREIYTFWSILRLYLLVHVAQVFYNGLWRTFSSKNGECKIYYCWFAFSWQPQICFSRIIILQNELTFEKACRMCSTIICPVSTNGIVVVWYLLYLPKVAKSYQKIWELWQGRIYTESFAQSEDS